MISAGGEASCADDEQLAALLENVLGSSESEALRQHIFSCEACCQRLLAAGASSTPAVRESGFLALPAPLPIDSLKTAAWEPPAQFEHFRLLRRLGQGSMGQVFVGHDGLLDRAVAIKFIAAVSPDEAARQRFMREARAIARLVHPNVVTVHSVGQVDGHPYLVTELVRGRSLAQLERPQPTERVLPIAIDLCRGLAAAHRRGVLHRDLKPANAILSDEGSVKLLDFGLAKLVSRQRPPSSQPEITDLRDEEETPESAPPHPTASVTQRGVLIGTPLYIAPEIWLGQPASVQTDLYSLGAVLFELCTGFPPVRAGSLADLRRRVLAGEIPACADLAASMDVRLAQAIDRCLVRDPVVRPRSAEALLQDLLSIQPQHARRLPDGNPYRGLHVFHAEHRALFFGRETELTEALERLRTQSLLVLLGDSGVGKSSLAYAAILPDVASEAFGDGRRFRTMSLTPGTDPAMALATALSRALRWQVPTLYEQIREEPAAAARAVQDRLASDEGLLIFIDQMEELATTAQPDSAQHTAEFLAQLALGWPGLRVLATLRADFLTRIGALPGLGRMLPTSVQMILPLDRSARRLVMTEPLRQKGYAFETEAMIDEILDAVPGDGGLPLLQFSLSMLWELRDSARRTLAASALRQIGGPTGALAHHADLLLASLLPAQRAAARRVLCKLVSAEDTRRPRPESQLLSGDGAEKAALSALVQGRLVIAREASDGDSCYELTHEALIRDWPTLRDWLTNEGERRAVRQRLEEATAHWEALQRSSEALWGDAPLDDLTHTGVDPNLLGEREQVFLTRSMQARRRRRRLRRTAYVVLPLLAVVLGASAILSVQSRRNTERTESFRQKEADLNTVLLARTPGNERQLLRQALESVAPELRTGRPLSQNALARLRSAVHVGRQSLPLVGHAKQVIWAAFAPDSRRVVTLDLQEQALVWEVSSGRRLFALRHDEALSYHIFYSPDGRFILAPLLNGKTRVWESESGHWLVDLDASTKSASHVAFSPDGRFAAIASGLSARAVPVTVIWDLASFRPLRILNGHTQQIQWVAYSPDGLHIASGAHDGTVRLFDASTGQQQHVWQGSSQPPSRVLFSPNGQIVLGAYFDGSARLWRVSDGQEMKELKGHRGEITDAVFSGTGAEVLTAGQDGTVRVWDTATGQAKHVLVGHESRVNSVRWLSSADRIVSAGDDGEIRYWHLHTGCLISRLRGHRAFASFAFPSPDGRYMISGGGKDDPPRLWSATSFLNTLPISRAAERAYHIPTSLLLVESPDSSVHSVWDARSGLPISQLHADGIGASTIIGWSNDGEYVWTRGYRKSDRSVNIFHVRSGELRSTLIPKTANHPHHVLAARANVFFDISIDNQARFSDAFTNKTLMTYPLRDGKIAQISISLNGDYGGVTYNDGELILINLRRQKLYSCGFQSTSRSRMLNFTPSAEYVIFLQLDGRYRVLRTIDCGLMASGSMNAESWDMVVSPDEHNAVPTGLSSNLVVIGIPNGEINELSRMHNSSISNVSFSLDGKRLVSSSYDTTVRVFDFRSKQQISVFVEHGAYVNSAEFSPDGSHIASASADGTVRIWDPLTGQPVQPPEDGHLLRPVVSLSENEWQFLREAPPKSPQEGTELIQMGCQLLRNQPEYPAVASSCAKFTPLQVAPL